MKRQSLFCFCFIFLSGCSQFSEPLIEGEMVKLTVECANGETIKIDEPEALDDVIEEINHSRREGSQEMEFDFEHRATLESSESETITFNLFSNGKAVLSEYYIHSAIDDFCEK